MVVRRNSHAPQIPAGPRDRRSSPDDARTASASPDSPSFPSHTDVSFPAAGSARTFSAESSVASGDFSTRSANWSGPGIAVHRRHCTTAVAEDRSLRWCAGQPTQQDGLGVGQQRIRPVHRCLQRSAGGARRCDAPPVRAPESVMQAVVNPQPPSARIRAAASSIARGVSRRGAGRSR